jgi:hypothetical protein
MEIQPYKDHRAFISRCTRLGPERPRRELDLGLVVSALTTERPKKGQLKDHRTKTTTLPT